MGHRTRFRVRFGDVDQAGIVYYPILVHYTHLALEDFFNDHLGIDYAFLIRDKRLGLPAVDVDMQFKSPLHFGDVVEIDSAVENVGRTSVTWRHTIYRAGVSDVAALARIVTVCVDLDSFRKQELPADLKQALTAS